MQKVHLIPLARRTHALQTQLKRLERRLDWLHQRSARYAQIRLGIFAIGGLLSAAVLFNRMWVIGGICVVMWLTAFGTAVYIHRQIEQSLIKHQIWRQIKAAQLARIRLDWSAIPAPMMGRAAASHPFAHDLDLTGERSIHRLIDTCVSTEGSQRLRDWLLDPDPALADIQRRQKLVQALVPRFLFRHKLAQQGMLSATGASGSWDSERLLQWLSEDQAKDRWAIKRILIAAAILAPINLILLMLYAWELAPPFWYLPLIIYIGLQFVKGDATTGVFNQAMALQNKLKNLTGVFQLLETYPLNRDESLGDLCQPFLQADQKPSTQLTAVSRVAMAVGVTQNPALAVLFNLAVPWNLFFAYRLIKVKATLASMLPQWLDIWFELEALSSLAGFAYLNPDYHFPEIIHSSTNPSPETRPIFEAQSLGHPLLPRTDKVCNTFAFAKLGEVAIITGSNMAGKSSFLRTIGINLALAYAGGPVNAAQLRTTQFRLFSCLNVSDSVTDGISYFYAEVRRLKALLVALERDNALPLLFLIDEIFRGTNNRERYQGSHAYIRALVSQNGVGLIATHDLELVKLAEDLPLIKNYHFRETVAEGRMVFDYRLRPGPCPTTNALKIMALAGLPIDVETNVKRKG